MGWGGRENPPTYPTLPQKPRHSICGLRKRIPTCAGGPSHPELAPYQQRTFSSLILSALPFSVKTVYLSASLSISLICAMRPFSCSFDRPCVVMRVPVSRISLLGSSPTTSRPFAIFCFSLTLYRFASSLYDKIVPCWPLSAGWLSIPLSSTFACWQRFVGFKESVDS